MTRGTARDGCLIGIHILRPELTILEVARIELPELVRLLKSFREANTLLFIADIQHAFNDGHPIFGEVFFKCIDLRIALLDLFRRRETANFYDKHIFIMRPVENAYIALLGNSIVNAPEIIPRQFV